MYVNTLQYQQLTWHDKNSVHWSTVWCMHMSRDVWYVEMEQGPVHRLWPVRISATLHVHSWRALSFCVSVAALSSPAVEHTHVVQVWQEWLEHTQLPRSHVIEKSPRGKYIANIAVSTGSSLFFHVYVCGYGVHLAHMDSLGAYFISPVQWLILFLCFLHLPWETWKSCWAHSPGVTIQIGYFSGSEVTGQRSRGHVKHL